MAPPCAPSTIGTARARPRVDSPTFHIDTDTEGPPCLHLGTFPNRSFSRFFDGAIPGMLADAVRWPIYEPPQGNCLISKDS
ncbi:hypothetical protein CBM2586_B130250 [Cupriavidus phytorum]|uniref:Uncharacterized protein n=1 Tax=Cupriavidus taiwanensis TaxID=164546 RepID=A0A975XHT1_9BURK|nr:hypothetical protein CBM2586_B130250 [Cupriavidus taiwanensis]